ncbi:WD40 repeat domain-containing protein [Actinoplanes derwentensis]|uniref:WD40 repeat domain-containing protein n=1 Tax=Actinoplanes derwentensis TaxID=113562 RepID=UPI0012FDDA52|nr:WD40 repeat domain-containing protein [Actinoplanes derwentensis]
MATIRGGLRGDPQAVEAGRSTSGEIGAATLTPSSGTNVLVGHTDYVNSIDWTTTGTGQVLLATGSDDTTARVWDPDTGETLTTLTGHANIVWSVAWATTGTGQLLLATASGDRTARIWNPHTGETITTLDGHTGTVWSAAWATTDTGQLLLATGSDDGTARIWNPHTGETITTLDGHTGTVWSAAWATTDARELLLATASGDNTARIWNPHTGDTITTLTGHTSAVNSVAWATTDTGQPLLATASEDNTARIWNPHTGDTITTLTGHTSAVNSVAWATTDTGQPLLATASSDDTARIWSPHTGNVLATAEHLTAVWSVAPQPGRGGMIRLATGTQDGQVCLFDLTYELSASVRGEEGGRTAGPMAVMPYGRLGPVPASSIRVGAGAESVLTGHTSFVNSVAWTTTDSGQPLLATASSDGTTRIWNPHTGETITTLTGHTGRVWCVAWATTDTGQLLIATASDDNTARIWNPHTGETITTLTEHTDPVWSVAWATTDTGQLLIATASGDDTARIWNPHTGHTITTLTGHTNIVRSVAWATTDTGQPLIATGSEDHTARIWNPHTGHTITTLTGHTNTVRSVAWATTDTGQPLIATASDDHTARIWNPHTGHTITTLTEHTGLVRSVAWATTNTGQLLIATASRDNTARIWNPHTGHTITTLTEHTNSFWSVAWATRPGRSDQRHLAERGTFLAVGCRDGTVYLHEIIGVAPVAVRPFDVMSEAHADRAPAPRDAIAGLVGLGRGGLWPPLGLVADLLAMTGDPSSRGMLNDSGLAELDGHPFLRRAAGLKWPPAARAAVVGLITAQFEHPERFALPAAHLDAAAPALRAGRAVGGDPGRKPRMGSAEVRAALDAMPERILDLLIILGPEALSADPAMALRLSSLSDRLPELPPEALTVLGGAAAGANPATNRAVLAVAGRPAAGDVARTDPLLDRHGPPHRLIHSHLGLPGPVHQALAVTEGLLYRRIPGIPPSECEPTALVLDVSPATYGPVEVVLRSLVHLVVNALWKAGAEPLFLTADPSLPAVVLTRPGQLAHVWTARSLAPPDLHAATAEAHATGRSVVLLTHLQTALAQRLPGTAEPHLTVVTTQTPGMPVTPVPTHPRHHHLGALPTADELVALAAVLLTGDRGTT